MVTPRMGRVLRGFQYQVAQRLKRQLLRRRLDGKFEYTLEEAERVEATKSEAGFEPMETYIWRRHNTVTQYIATRLILDLCEASEMKQGGSVGMWCW